MVNDLENDLDQDRPLFFKIILGIEFADFTYVTYTMETTRLTGVFLQLFH